MELINANATANSLGPRDTTARPACMVYRSDPGYCLLEAAPESLVIRHHRCQRIAPPHAHQHLP
jgi:hypothetical protein